MYGSFSLILKHNIPRPQPQKCRWDTKESFPSIASLWSSVIGFCYIGGKKFQDWTRTGSGPGFDLADRQNLHIYRWWQTDDAVWPIDSKPQVAYSKPLSRMMWGNLCVILGPFSLCPFKYRPAKHVEFGHQYLEWWVLKFVFTPTEYSWVVSRGALSWCRSSLNPMITTL